jgi:hypothetical protein
MRTTNRGFRGRLLLLLFLTFANLLAAVGAREALAVPACGDGTGTSGISAADALLALKKAVGQAVACLPCACDVNADSSVTAADSLAILKRAVGSARYLSCIADAACTVPSPRLDTIVDATADPSTLAEVTGAGFDAQAPTWLRIFGGPLSIEVPAVVLAGNRVGGAVPPLAAGVVAPAGGFRVQALQGFTSPVVASNVLTGLAIAASPTPPEPKGKVTADFLLGAVERADELLEEVPPGSDMATALFAARSAMTRLHAEVVALRDHTRNSVSLGTRDSAALTLTREDLAQVDAMILASLLAQAELPTSPAMATISPEHASLDFGTAVTHGTRVAGKDVNSGFPAPVTATAQVAGTDCRQPESAAYVDALLHSPDTVTARHNYFSAPCAAAATKTSYAVVLGSAALATGILALTGVTAAGVALALPAAAVLYISIAGAGGLIAVGGALADTSDDAVALVKQGVAQAESTMQSLVKGYVLPGVTGPLYDMASAVKDLSEAFALFDPTTTTTIPPSSTSTTSTSSTSTFAPPACYCCCAFWVGNTFSCRELGSPQSPPDSEAFCVPYNQDFCDSDLCEND